MKEIFDGHSVSLHVRKSNKGAIHLYKDTLKFNVNGVEAKYYADKEDAYKMTLDMQHKSTKKKRKPLMNNDVASRHNDKCDHTDCNHHPPSTSNEPDNSKVKGKNSQTTQEKGNQSKNTQDDKQQNGKKSKKSRKHKKRSKKK